MKTKLLFSAVCMLFTANAFAYDFAVDNIAYNITSPTTVETTWNEGFLLTGDIVVPAQVVYQSTSYTVTAIGPNTFNGCDDRLKSVSIPSTVTSIGHYAFYGCSGITSISIPSAVNYIGERGFINCSKLTSITIPASLPRIYSEVFAGCEGLTSVAFELPSSLTQIDFGAFEYCGQLTTIDIPATVTTIGSRAFQFCVGLETINIPNSVSSMGIYAFDDTPWFANQPQGLVYAGSVAYSYKGVMPENTSIVLNDGTTGICEYAFYGFRNLVSVSIPSSVRVIGRSAFEYCSGLNAVYSHAVTPVNLEYSYDIFRDANTTTSTLYVPVGSKGAYQAANQWQDFTNIEESTFTATNEINEKYKIHSGGRQIIVSNIFAKTVCVYNVFGKKLTDIKSADQTARITVTNPGIYLVSVDDVFTKILVE